MYKLLRNIDGELKSCNSHLDEAIQVTYKPGKWTSPIIENSAIYTFDSLENVIEFLRINLFDDWRDFSYELWEIEGSKTIPPNIIVPSFCDDAFFDKVLKFWKKEVKEDSFFIGSGPKGTVAYDKIKLKKKLLGFAGTERIGNISNKILEINL